MVVGRWWRHGGGSGGGELAVVMEEAAAVMLDEFSSPRILRLAGKKGILTGLRSPSDNDTDL